MFLFLFAACGTPATTTDDDGGGDSGADTAAETNDTEPTCAALTTARDWAFNGACPQMRTPCEIVVEGCSLSITYPSGMTMGMPYSGTIDGDTITFADDDSVHGCVGVIADPDTVSGTCGDGCEFTLQR